MMHPCMLGFGLDILLAVRTKNIYSKSKVEKKFISETEDSTSIKS